MSMLGKSFLLRSTLVLAALLAVPAVAQIVKTDVTFPKGSTGTTIDGAIAGEQTRDYVVRARAGQVLKVRMSGSAIVYFNVLPPGSSGEAIFIGSSAGNSFSGTLPTTGAYTIRVYQMRATARRGERGAFKLNISITGGGAAGGGNAGGANAGGGNAGSIAGIKGMNAIKAIDVLTARGFVNVDATTLGNTLYGIYFYRPTRLCVQTTSDNRTILDIKDIKTHPLCR